MDITQDIISEFRAFYPEFRNTTDWTAADLTRHLGIADEETGGRWGAYKANSLKQRGMFAFAAHRAVLAKASARAVENGGVAPAPAPVASKSVGDESASYAVATPTVSESIGLGDLRSTLYGAEFLRLRRRVGMGAIAV